MANNCFNYIQAFGSERGMGMFYGNLIKGTYEDDFILFGLGDFSKDPTSLDFSAESRWSPPKEKLQSLSKDYNLVIECEYDELGSDIAGKFGFDKGELVFNLEFTYLEGKYHFMEWSDFLECDAIPRLDDCESFNEFMDMFDFVNADQHAELVEIYKEYVTR
jgi:hypothetical protein